MISRNLRHINKSKTPRAVLKCTIPWGSSFLMHHISRLLTRNISCDKGASATFQSKPRMGNTSSMSHPGLLHVKATSATLLTRNLFPVISPNLRPQTHCPEWRWAGRKKTTETTERAEKIERIERIEIFFDSRVSLSSLSSLFSLFFLSSLLFSLISRS